MSKIKETILEGGIIGIGATIIVVIIAILFAFPIKWLWNWLMPVIFNLPEITVWQALGLNVLSSFLIRSTHSSSK